MFLWFVQQAVIDWLDVQVREDAEGNSGGVWPGTPCGCQVKQARFNYYKLRPGAEVREAAYRAKRIFGISIYL